MTWPVTTSTRQTPETFINPKGFNYVQWNWPTPADPKGYYNLDCIITPEVDSSTDGYFFAHQFFFNGLENVGGYLGLQTAGGHTSPHVGTKIAVFSVWNATAGSGTEYSAAFSGEGTGWSTRITYPWVINRPYLLRIWFTGSSTVSDQWTAYVVDTVTGVETVIGTIKSPTGAQLLSPVSINFQERYSGALSSSSVQPSAVLFTGVRANSANNPPIEPESQWNTINNVTGAGPFGMQVIRDGARCYVGVFTPPVLKTLKSGFETGASGVTISVANSGGTSTPEQFRLNNARTSDFVGGTTTLDSSKWIPKYPWATAEGSSNDNNAEMQWHLPANVVVADGVCRLVAKVEPTTHVTQVFPSGKNYTHTSGIITTGPDFSANSPAKFGFTYGHVEARIKIPTGKGLLPAMRLFPTDVSWPPEIDIMEVLGQDTDTLHLNHHYTDSTTAVLTHSNASVATTDLSLDYHVYGLEWSASVLRWYLDGVVVRTFTDVPNITNKQMYLLINLAVGGTWPGAPDGSTSFPAELLVDWVKVWQTAAASTGARPLGQTTGNWEIKFQDDFNTVTATPITPTPPVGTRGNFAGPGGKTWTKLFDEEFNTNCAEGQFLNVYGTKANGHEAWGAYNTGWPDTQGNPNNNSNPTNSGYDNNILSVQDGILRKRLHTRADGRQVAATPYPRLPGQTSCSLLYGRIESRLRVLNPKRGWKTAWLWWPDSEIWPRDGEIDFPEGDLDGTIGGFMHRQNATSGSDQDYWGSGVRYDSGWNVVVMEWAPNYCRFGVNGTYSPVFTNRVPNTRMHWVMQTETVLTNTASERPVAGETTTVEVDYCAVWSLV